VVSCKLRIYIVNWVWRDTRFALRILIKDRGFLATASGCSRSIAIQEVAHHSGNDPGRDLLTLPARKY
jgi:hypothetical protein